MSVTARFDITLVHSEDGNVATGCVVLPEDLAHWSKGLEQSIKNTGHIMMVVDTLSMGTGGCVIGFRGAEDNADITSGVLENRTLFGFSVDRDTLTAIRDALDFAVKQYQD